MRNIVRAVVRGLGFLSLMMGSLQIPFFTPMCYFGGMKPGFDPSHVAWICGRGALIIFAICFALFWLSRHFFPNEQRSTAE